MTCANKCLRCTRMFAVWVERKCGSNPHVGKCLAAPYLSQTSLGQFHRHPPTPSSSPSQDLASVWVLASYLFSSTYLSVTDTPGVAQCSGGSLLCSHTSEGSKKQTPPQTNSGLKCTCERGSVKKTYEKPSIFQSQFKVVISCNGGKMREAKLHKPFVLMVGLTTTLSVFPSRFDIAQFII